MKPHSEPPIVNEKHYPSNDLIVHPLLSHCGHIQCLHSYILSGEISASNQEVDNSNRPIKKSTDHITVAPPPGGQIKTLCIQN